MLFTQIPTQHAPLGGKVVYAFDTEAAAGELPIPDTEIRIVHTADGALLGAKRFAGVTAAAFDAAPYLRRAMRFVPSVSGTGVYSAAALGRTITAQVEAAAGVGKVTAPDRTFLPCSGAVDGAAVLTSMPRTRLIAPGECDELTLRALGAGMVTITAETAEGLVAQSYGIVQAGIHIFRLDTRDFPGARRITVDAGACGEVVYTLLTAPEGARRLAWRSAAGSIEHYTFPAERSERIVAEKSQAESVEGRIQFITGCERRKVLASAYESRAVLDGLAGIVCAEQVWEVVEDEYLPVAVENSEAVIHRQGALSLLEIEIRATHKTQLPWS